MKNIFKRIFNYPLIIIFSFSFSSFQRFFQLIFMYEILNYQTFFFVNLLMLLLTGLYTNFRAFLFFLVFVCQSNVKVELEKIFFDFLAIFKLKKNENKDCLINSVRNGTNSNDHDKDRIHSDNDNDISKFNNN